MANWNEDVIFSVEILFFLSVNSQAQLFIDTKKFVVLHHKGLYCANNFGK